MARYRDPLLAAWQEAARDYGLRAVKLPGKCPKCGAVKVTVDLTQYPVIAQAGVEAARRLAEQVATKCTRERT